MPRLFQSARMGLAGLMLGATAGCCSLGDPACAIPRELYDREFGRELLYCPNLSVEGLNRTAWYCDPLSWEAECPPSLQCGPDYPLPAPSARAVYALPVRQPGLDAER